jgi:hypothetical protein
VNFAERAARNEEIFRGVNEQIEEGAEQHHVKGPLPFHCECGQASCLETIELAPPEYERVAAERYRFLLVPGHEDPLIESRSLSATTRSWWQRRSVRRETRSTATILNRATGNLRPAKRQAVTAGGRTRDPAHLPVDAR